MSESATNVKFFWHDCGPKGWCRAVSDEAIYVGCYLDYGHDQNCKHDGPTIHCSAYVLEQIGVRMIPCGIGHTGTWVRTVDEAHRWIEHQVSEHLAM